MKKKEKETIITKLSTNCLHTFTNITNLIFVQTRDNRPRCDLKLNMKQQMATRTRIFRDVKCTKRRRQDLFSGGLPGHRDHAKYSSSQGIVAVVHLDHLCGQGKRDRWTDRTWTVNRVKYIEIPSSPLSLSSFSFGERGSRPCALPGPDSPLSRYLASPLLNSSDMLRAGKQTVNRSCSSQDRPRYWNFHFIYNSHRTAHRDITYIRMYI